MEWFIWHMGEGFERLRALKNLQTLDLAENHFVINGILPSISTLLSLKQLYLSQNNYMKGLTHFEDLKKLSSLETLDLGLIPLGTRDVDILGALPMLKKLGLEFCNLIGSLSGLKNLSRLESLYLRGNYLDSSIFYSLGPLPNLKLLSLSDNSLNGSISSQGLKMLSSLEDLDLSQNRLDTSILDSLAVLPKLKRLNLQSNYLNGLMISSQGLQVLNKLESLDLSSCGLDIRILDSLGTLSKLRQLNLGYNNFSGSLPNQAGLCGLKSLKELDLSYNNMQGTLPPCLGNLTSLRVLDLSHNQFVGNIASSPIVSLVSLEKLVLSNNHFESLAPFSSFANHSKLVYFELISGTNTLQVETEYPTSTWVPSFQLQFLSLANCKVNMPTGVLPKFLYHQMDLTYLSFAKLNLQAEFPSWLLKNNTRLEFLNLQENSLTGTLLLDDLPPHPELKELVVLKNYFHGNIPTNIATSLPNLEVLDLSTNSFQGHILSSFGDMLMLAALDLSSNNFSGEVPQNLAQGRSLQYLKLSKNNLHGQIFPTFSGKSSPPYLYLDRNHFTGVLPHSFPYWTVLDIRNNYITGELPSWTTGELPSWMYNVWNLKEFLVSNNHLQGPIPENFCYLQKLEVLDLSNNNLSGPIPPCFSPPSIRYANLGGNVLTGSMETAFMNSYGLVTLDVGENSISGGIPNWIGSLWNLRILVFKGNQFQGNIPIQLCNLHQISMIDLSFNNLSGPIPSCLGNLINMTTDPWNLFVPWANDSLLFQLSTEDPNKKTFEVIRLLGIENDDEEHVEFTTKNRNYPYRGETIQFVSGVDLSSNHLTGDIPPEIGNLSLIHALNLSHNHLTGTIPSTFANLKAIESLDLSFNNLGGPLPTQLVELYSLAVFSVAHNNLSGMTPDRKAQFASFEESCYEGNPFLCGPPLKKNCTSTGPSSSSMTDNSSINLVVFFASFAASFVIGFVGVISVLYINPYWRRVWFQMVERWIVSVEYFLVDSFYKLKHWVRA